MAISHVCFLSSSSTTKPNAEYINCCSTTGNRASLLSGYHDGGDHMSSLIPPLSYEQVTLSADSLQQLLLQQQVRNLKVPTRQYIQLGIYQLV